MNAGVEAILARATETQQAFGHIARMLGDDSMAPRYQSDYVIMVNPGYACEPGKDVVVTLNDGRLIVGNLLSRSDAEIRLQLYDTGWDWQSGTILALQLTTVRAVERVSVTLFGWDHLFPEATGAQELRQ